LELEMFPFDTQDITVWIASKCSDEDVQLLEDDSEVSKVNVESLVTQREWSLYKHVQSTTKSISNDEGSSSRFTALGLRCHASRRLGFYIWNIYFIMFVICTLVFATFAVKWTETADRIHLTFILLLTSTSFKKASKSAVPQLSYLTFLDYSILSTIVTYSVVVIWHSLIASVIAKYYEEADVTYIDQCFLATCACTYAFTHIVFSLYILFHVLRRHREIKLMGVAHQMKLIAQKKLTLSL
jgi:hypothetical protein